MKIKKRLRLLLYGSLLFPLCLSGQDASSVRFVNRGKMNVATNASASLYIPWAVKMTGESSIVQNGKTCIGGSFFQHASTNVFKVDTYGWGTSSGTISFMKENTGAERHITVIDESITAFDRSARYVAFPKIQINTNDRITVPERMGMDAREVKLTNVGSTKGILYLQSNPDAAKAKVFDASLRITGSGTSSALVDLGSVVVERDLSIYRNSASNDGNSGYGALFGFASPFTAQKAGYFAGNYVRSVSAGLNETDYKSANWHAKYPYANETGTDGIILSEYYVRGVHDYFNPTQAYLIRPQVTGSNYTDLPVGFINTGGGNHDLAKFIFNGAIYSLAPYKEQVFAEDYLVNRTLNLNQADMTSTFNWVIGNSYTCAIDAQAIKKQIMETSALYYYEVIYVCPPGSTTFQPYYTGTSGTPQVVDLTDIPSQTIFMVRVAKNFAQKGSFQIGRNMLTHGKRSHNLKSTTAAPFNELLFRLSPEDAPNIYDLAAVGLRSDTRNAIEKVQLGASDCFQVYSPNGDNTPMSVNLLDTNADCAPLSVKAPSTGGRFVLNISRIQSVTTGSVWLKDLKTGMTIDLGGYEDYNYTFDAEPNDNPDRFMIYFRAPTALDEVTASYITCYYANNNLIIKGLLPQDENSVVSVTDMKGRLIQKTVINNYPEMTIPVNIAEGVYIAKISGNRHTTIKFIK